MAHERPLVSVLRAVVSELRASRGEGLIADFALVGLLVEVCLAVATEVPAGAERFLAEIADERFDNVGWGIHGGNCYAKQLKIMQINIRVKLVFRIK